MLFPVLLAMLLASSVEAQQVGSIRGVVHDKDFDALLPGAEVQIVGGERVTTTDQGTFVFREVAPGTYTLVFSKEGYVRQVRTDVVVSAGKLTDLEVWLSGDFTEMEEFVVQDTQLGAGTESGLLELRFDSPSLLDSIGADLMSRAGASDAASALKLVAGASVQDGKYAVVRGLPDRYVSSQMNGVRLPTADEDKRAVELDQFPAAVIESIQVKKTFTPDQQGDASGGAVDLRLKSVPEESIFQLKGEYGYNTQATGRSDFLTYDGGGVNFWGRDGGRNIQGNRIGDSWTGAVGVSRDDAPVDYKWSLATGGKLDVDDGVRIGGFASFFYERDSSFYDNGVDDSYWVENPGDPLTPQTFQGVPTQGSGDFKTSLLDVTRGSQLVQWGALSTVGLETDNHSVGLTYLYTRTAEDTATLAEDTRGKAYFYPGYDPDDPMGTGNEPENRRAAPYIRTETLDYVERATSTIQVNGRHRIPIEGLTVDEGFTFGAPELDWTFAHSSASLDEPDKRQFGSLWLASSYNPGVPPFFPPTTDPAEHQPFLPAANFNLGNLQRIFKTIDETSNQFFANLKLPFEQWSGDPGYLKFGLFEDRVDRQFTQETFSNLGDEGARFFGDFDEFWSEVFPDEDHAILESLRDVDYHGKQDISAWYAMGDLPVSPSIDVIGGVRFESTRISTVNDPESEAVWFPPGATAETSLNPGDGDGSIDQENSLPAIGLIVTPTEQVTVRASYSETIARPTFKELTPIIQQEFLGGPVFIGNPDLGLSALKNYDLRVDYEPYAGSLVSASWFFKDVTDPIENVQRIMPFNYTTAVNYPEGRLKGYELEVRQDLGRLSETLGGVRLGANATFIDSRVTIPEDEQAMFELPNILAPMKTRDATNAPDHLYNLFLTYDLPSTGTQAGLFYTVVGDTLVAGAGQADGNFVPSVYAKQYDTLNLTFSQRIGRFFTIKLQAKNLTNPQIEEVYRSRYTGGDLTKTSYTKGIDFTIGFSLDF